MKKIIIAIFALCLLNSCDKELLDVSSDEFNSSELKSSVDRKTKEVTVPFKSNFYTEQEDIAFGACVGDPEWLESDVYNGDLIGLNTQVGGGNATHLGKFTTVMTFCMNFNQTDPENFAKYSAVDGIFIAANGDELYFTVSGRVLFYAEANPNYVAYFDDEFTFTGGTGRFYKASGYGHTNSFTKEGLLHTDHNWTGWLTLLKGK